MSILYYKLSFKKIKVKFKSKIETILLPEILLPNGIGGCKDIIIVYTYLTYDFLYAPSGKNQENLI